jgi:NAD(P)-dependent dehydrogenase (short-subunit alcohol dehydrogenase family)
MKKFTDRNVPDQSGKTFFISGANTGIGFECAKVLASKNARVLLGCRNLNKAENAKQAILNEFSNANVSCIILDLSDFESVRAAAEVVNREPHLDVLINNAGIMMPPLEYTVQGFESQFGVNHLGPFLLTSLLLDKLRARPKARIVNTSSLAHLKGKIYFDDINAKQSYNKVNRYCQSKLANLLFTYELQRYLDNDPSDLISVACHPGVASTELSRHFPRCSQLIAPIARLLFNTPLEGAWPTLMAATSNSVQAADYFGPSKRMQMVGPAMVATPKNNALDTQVAKKLWAISCDMTEVYPFKQT